MLEGTKLAVFNLRFQAAIQDHVAKKAASKRTRDTARRTAAELRHEASRLEALMAVAPVQA